ncbi:MAG: AMP-binding protein, partial [Actinomycetes bacterium]
MKTNEVPLLVTSLPGANITDLLIHRVKLDPNLVLMAKQTQPGVWEDVSAGDYLKEVTDLAKGFIAAGIEVGQRVGIMSHTRYEWALCDFALWFAGAVSVPIYESSAPSQIEWILSDSGATAALFEDATLLELFRSVKSNLPKVTQQWVFESNDLQELVELGKKVTDQELESRRTANGLQDLATIIYTS